MLVFCLVLISAPAPKFGGLALFFTAFGIIACPVILHHISLLFNTYRPLRRSFICLISLSNDDFP
jgi:hypothetical protein